MHAMRRMVAIVLSSLLLCGLILTNPMDGYLPILEANAEQGESLSESNVENSPPAEQKKPRPQHAESSDVSKTTEAEDSKTSGSSDAEKPVEAEEPAKTEKPAETEKPARTEAPETETPIEIKESPETKQPQDEEDPLETKEPSQQTDGEFDGEEPQDKDGERRSPGDVILGDRELASATPGETLTIAIPIHYVVGNRTYKSNIGARGGIKPYRNRQTEAGYDQAIAEALPELRVSVTRKQEKGFPLTPNILGREQKLISNGKNFGYAVFENVSVRESAEPGTYSVRLRVSWKGADGQGKWKIQTGHIRVIEPNDRSGESTEIAPEIAPEIDREIEDETEPDETPDEEPDLDEELNEELGEELGEEPGEEPGDELDEEPEEEAAPDHGDVMLGEYDVPIAEAGGKMTLAFPVRYTRGDMVYHTNAGMGGGMTAYGATPEFDQSLANELSELSITVAAEQVEGFPLAGILSHERSLVSNGKNMGYAVFEDAPVPEDAGPGCYPIRLQAAWRTADGENRSKLLVGMIEVIDKPSEPGDVSLGDYETPSAEVGGTINLTFPMQYTRGEMVYETNESTQGGILAYDRAHTARDYDQSVTDELAELRVAIAAEQAEDCPLAPEALPGQQEIVSDGRNLGYAAFDGLPVLETAEPGEHPVRLDVSWLEVGASQWQTKTLTATVLVEGITNPVFQSDDMELGAFPPLRVLPGEMFTIAVPLCYIEHYTGKNDLNEDEDVELTYDTNAKDGDLIPYDVANQPSDYDQSIAGVLSELSVTIAAGQDANFPLDLALPAQRSLIADGQNLGYAVFEGVSVLEEAELGMYPMKLLVTWRRAGKAAQNAELMTYVYVGLEGPLLYGKNGVIVFTHTQLKDALQSSEYDPVYLGYCDADMPPESWEQRNDGTIRYPNNNTSGINLRRSVTIIGTDPRNRQRITLIDKATSVFNRAATTDGIYLNAGGITVTLRDVKVMGYNSSGIIGSRVANTQTHYINLEYTGTRAYAAASANTSVSFTGCNVKITNMGSGSMRAQEAMRGGEVILRGTNTFIRADAYVSTFDHAVFWVDYAPHNVIVAAGADVTVDTNNYLIMDATNLGAQLTLNVQGRLHVTTRGNNGCVGYGTYYINECTIGAGGELITRHLGSGYGSLRVNRLTVNGSLDMEINTTSATAPCIALLNGSSTCNFNSPKKVRLAAQGAGYLFRAAAGTPTVNINGISALNRWPRSGTVAKYIWNNQGVDKSPFHLSFTVSTGGAVGSVKPSGLENTNKGVALNAQTLNGTYFLVNNSSKTIMFGQYELSIDGVYDGATFATGTAPSGAALTITERSANNLNDVKQTIGPIAAGNRSWMATLQKPLVSGTRVYVVSIKDEFEAHTYTDRREPICRLFSVPETFDFGTVHISGNPQLVNPTSDWTIQILDTMQDGTWTLTANADPLTAQDGSDSLPNAMVFVQPDGRMDHLSQGSSVFIADKQPGDPLGFVDRSWTPNDGLHVQLAPYEGKPGLRYSTTITWTLDVS